MYGGKEGYHASYLGRIGSTLGQSFGIPSVRNDVLGEMIVVTVNQSSAERLVLHDSDGRLSGMAFLTPFEDGIFAKYRGMLLCKWSGRDFVPATPEENARHNGVSQLSHDGLHDRIFNGWYVRAASGRLGDSFEIKLNNGSILKGRNRATSSLENASYAIDLVQPNGNTEKLYDVDGTSRTVSKVEYETIFSTKVN